ncbi:Pimeloyl-(acyl-carrier protein) methyl ester esterase [Candidatus Accumulibacter aalborgensis]|uniref:Pimeloyl-[acyl-carrier protein] methyl ester esterase n=1 Tax=Candidatus Accumulibacter aalborgensis TaxID=1860102 RepID=A0A1A8XRZ8_9PROT|nr:pimeloyl-ACP methyl ester esterase BioH [Candidatus Accumulibacter aalborgensis]SBT07252.1 Pimeloyl-(acyl-carrier protein) methyl ester esterase [Candidatus Accumulibacter aalborgensis]
MSAVIGQGPDLALIHGWGLDSAVWQPLLAALAQRFRVHLVDLPGYGAAPDDSADFTNTAQAVIDALPHPVTLCGWSLGAMLALRAARLSPEKVKRLILVGATASFTQRADWPAGQAPEVVDSFAASVRLQAQPTLQRFIALLSQGDIRARAISRTLTAGLRQAPTPDVETLSRGLNWLREVDLRPLLPTVTARCLLIHGENDSLIPLAAAQCLAKTLPNARLEVFAAAGHAPFLNDPERFVRLLDDFHHAPASP